MDGQVLNLDMLNESSGGDVEFARELFSDLVVRAKEIRQDLEAALAQGDAEKVRKSAHELKGSSLTLGAERLAAACKDLEYQAKNGDLGQSPATLETLCREMEALWEALKREGLHP